MSSGIIHATVARQVVQGAINWFSPMQPMISSCWFTDSINDVYSSGTLVSLKKKKKKKKIHALFCYIQPIRISFFPGQNVDIRITLIVDKEMATHSSMTATCSVWYLEAL